MEGTDKKKYLKMWSEIKKECNGDVSKSVGHDQLHQQQQQIEKITVQVCTVL